jgi:hypothetical protein
MDMTVNPESTLTRYARWLPLLSEKDRQYARDQHAEVVRILAACPDRPTWLEMYYRWTLAGLDAEGDQAAALRLAVAGEAEDCDPAEVCRALAAMDRTSHEWAQWWPAWHPSAN